MSKRIEVLLVDPMFDEMTAMNGYPLLYPIECSNILEQFEGEEISKDDAIKAIDTLTAYFFQERLCKMVMDIYDRDRDLSKTKEMTIEEIEKKLGYKVKIVGEKEEK